MGAVSAHGHGESAGLTVKQAQDIKKINGKTTLGCLIRGFNRPHPIENLREKTWVDELLEQFPDCPNPIMFPASAEYYLRMRLYFKQQKDT